MDEKNGNNGLHLTDKVIHQISGPVSMHYLVPGKSTFMGKPIDSLPLFMMWGDVHRDDTGMCDPCSEEKGCYPIYDRRFLQELDKLAADYPVDFYTEYSRDFPVYYTNNKNVLFARFLEKTTKACHVRTLRPRLQYESECPTKYTRWHYSDPRFMKDTMEHYLFTPVTRVFHFIHMQDTLERWRVAEPVEMGGINYIAEVLEEDRSTIAATYSAYTTIDTLEIQGLLHRIVVRILTPSKGDWMDSRRFEGKLSGIFDEYVTFLSPGGVEKAGGVGNKSVILKQFRKILPDALPLFREFLTKAFDVSMDRIRGGSSFLLRAELSINHLLPEIVTYIALFFDVSNPDFSTKKDELYRIMHDNYGNRTVEVLYTSIALVAEYLFRIKSFMVDVHTILRMIKPPGGSSPPYLALGYFGADHTHSMVRILQAPGIFGYRQEYEGVEQWNPISRCLTITKPIYLAKDLRKHAGALHKSNVAMRRYKQYKNIIFQEEASRREEGRLEEGRLGRLGRRSPQKTLKVNSPVRPAVSPVSPVRPPVPSPVVSPVSPVRPSPVVSPVRPAVSPVVSPIQAVPAVPIKKIVTVKRPQVKNKNRNNSKNSKNNSKSRINMHRLNFIRTFPTKKNKKNNRT